MKLFESNWNLPYFFLVQLMKWDPMLRSAPMPNYGLHLICQASTSACNGPKASHFEKNIIQRV